MQRKRAPRKKATKLPDTHDLARVLTQAANQFAASVVALGVALASLPLRPVRRSKPKPKPKPKSRRR